MTINGLSRGKVFAINIGLILVLFGAITPTTTNAMAQSRKRATRIVRSGKKAVVTKAMVGEAQQRLADLGYWIQGSDGKWGDASRHGLIAFQKVEGRARTGKLTIGELQALRAATRPAPHETGSAHVEVDLTRQVLFMVDDAGMVSKILPVSTGSGKLFTSEDGNEEYTEPAITPKGRFKVYRKLPGWRKSPLGLLYFPSYIVGGIAIHGNPAVPAQAESHGCIRIPMFAAEAFSDLTPIGTPVIVFGGANPGSPSVSR